MVLELEFCGDRQVIQVPSDCQVADFRQFINVYTGIAVGDQDLSLPEGATDSTVISTFITEGDLITLKIRNSGTSDAGHAAASDVPPPETRAAIERALAEDAGSPMANTAPVEAPPAAHVGSGGGIGSMIRNLASSIGMGGFGEGPDPVMHALGGILPAGDDGVSQKIRAAKQRSLGLKEGDAGSGQGAASVLRACLGQEQVTEDFDHVLTRCRRELRPLLCILYAPAEDSSVSLLGHLTQDFLLDLLRVNFVSWPCSIEDQTFDDFVRVVQNNWNLSYQLGGRISAQQIEFPLVVALVPDGAELQVGAFLMGDIAANQILEHVVSVVETHEPRLEERRELQKVGNEAATLQREQDEALEQARQEDAARLMSIQDEEDRQKREAAEALELVQQAKDEEVRREAEVLQRRKQRATGLRPEPAEGGVRVRFKLPGGDNIERRFVADAPLREMWEFLDTVDSVHETLGDVDSCYLVSRYPPMKLQLGEDGEALLQSKGFKRDALFLVERP